MKIKLNQISSLVFVMLGLMTILIGQIFCIFFKYRPKGFIHEALGKPLLLIPYFFDQFLWFEYFFLGGIFSLIFTTLLGYRMIRKNLLGKMFVTLLVIPSVISVTFWIIVSSYSHLLGMNSKSINIAKHPIHSRVSVKNSINNFPGQGSSHPVYVVTVIQPGFNQKIGTVSKLEKDVEELANKYDNAQDHPIKFAWSLDGKRLGASSLGRYIVVWNFNSMTVWKNVADSLEDLNTVHNWFERYLEQPFDLWEEQVKYKKLLIHNHNF